MYQIYYTIYIINYYIYKLIYIYGENYKERSSLRLLSYERATFEQSDIPLGKEGENTWIYKLLQIQNSSLTWHKATACTNSTKL